ncbi:MAG: 6-bladed beta-propeller, partial [Bacteroidales bacterium]
MGKLKLILLLLLVIQLYSQTLEFQLINKFEYELSEINDFSIDSDGNFYLLDSQDNCIYKYSETGKYVQTLARKGKGPGELLMPLLLEIDKSNNIVIANVGNSRFEVLSKSGDYISSFKFPSSSFATTAFKINSKNELIVAFNDNYQGAYHIQKWSLDGVLIKELCKFQKTSYSNLVKHP